MTLRIFNDRHDAGRRLAHRLHVLAAENPVVIALPRGGVPVAFEVARALDAPLDVLVVRKIGAPGNPELGMGAIAEGGVRVLNDFALRSLQLSPEEIEHATQRAHHELDERMRRYRGDRAQLDIRGRTVILVDDGLATGGTARAALRALRERKPRRLVLAVPVGAAETVDALAHECDEIVCLQQPDSMWAVGYWYTNFDQTTDTEVNALLAAANQSGRAGTGPAPLAGERSVSALERREILERCDIRIPVVGSEIIGDFAVPDHAVGIVVFAHGSGSSRQSPRNRRVAAVLNDVGLATLLIDLLTRAEERERANVFDITLLAERLGAATRWVRRRPGTGNLKIGYFGASTGAGAALWAAAEPGADVQAVVSRGGRPDLATPRLTAVRAPTLLIVGGLDHVVIDLNREALTQLRCEAALEIVPGATHLFEEPGALEQVARLAAVWFTRHLADVSSAGRSANESASHGAPS